jgi:hypothetical protein
VMGVTNCHEGNRQDAHARSRRGKGT